VPVSPTLDVGDGVWSPDGNAIVYTVFDQTRSCDHLERVTWSGTAWSAPVRVRDCAQTGEVITSLAWVVLL
jgi:Tol biopolymer transport system component